LLIAENINIIQFIFGFLDECQLMSFLPGKTQVLSSTIPALAEAVAGAFVSTRSQPGFPEARI
jgi:hypothetical protein